MRVRAKTSLRVHPIQDDRRPVGLSLAGITAELSRAEAHRLADQLHDAAEKETP